MQKEIRKGAPSFVVTLGLILFAGLLLYDIWYCTEAVKLTWLFVVIFVLFSVFTIRFTAVKYEYLVVGSEIIIHTIIGSIKIGTKNIPLESIKAIGSGKKINESMGYKYFANKCASFGGLIRGSTAVIYTKKGKLQRLRFEPSEQMRDYLRMRLSGKYYEH